MKNFLLKIGLTCLLFINSCSNKCVIGNIEVSELLSTVAKEQSINYCELLKKALTGNEDSIKKLSLFEFNDAVGYDHGAVIVNLIFQIGEVRYIKSISTINGEQKDLINSYIDVGLNYGNNPKKNDKDLKNVFPDLYVFLRNNE